ncbi:hypothetical protein OH77DRAFT_1432459 [Trametes cingulata]|nr:hypothetical protein OH77DRAFT_1432459 [Trametes cingulata]
MPRSSCFMLTHRRASSHASWHLYLESVDGSTRAVRPMKLHDTAPQRSLYRLAGLSISGRRALVLSLFLQVPATER